MRETIRFACEMPIIDLERAYRRRYAGYEHDIRYQVAQESSLGVRVEIDVPHMLEESGEFKEQMKALIETAARKVFYGAGELASEIMDKAKAKV